VPYIGVSLLIGVVFVALFLPERGIVASLRRAWWRRDRETAEDALKHIFKAGRRGGADAQSLAGALGTDPDRAAEIAALLAERGLVNMRDGRMHVTPDGRAYALQVIRAHRLWEHYLAQETGFLEHEWHARAEAAEHRLSPSEAHALSERLGHPTHDPHGDPIPTAEGEFVPHGGSALTDIDEDATVRIVHIEDEPSVVYAQLVAEGLQPGMLARVVESTPARVVLWSEEAEHVLAPIVAANVFAIETPDADVLPDEYRRLADLEPGERGTVAALSRSCRGAERRRLLDLGILPGTVVEAEFRSPTGDPTAYRIRGASIALRKRQADLIHIHEPQETSA
jgi:DtxR family Mn-dependent transcriptional regulator